LPHILGPLRSPASLRLTSEAALPASNFNERHGTAGFFRVWRSHPPAQTRNVFVAGANVERVWRPQTHSADVASREISITRLVWPGFLN
jgi:hypothetical protein